jgi:endonuclease III
MSSRLERIVATLKRCYGPLVSPPSDAFTLFVWEILSNHSTPRKRDAALAALKRHRALTPDAMWNAAPRKLEESVALAGPYRDQRLQGLRTGVDVFRRTPTLPSVVRGPAAAALRQLKQLPRLTGESGPYRMLLFAGDHAVLPVDARVTRVATRLGYGERSTNFTKTARSIRVAVAAELPHSVDAYRQAYTYLAHHGAATCSETNPRCDECRLLHDCPFGTSRDRRSE